MEENIAVSTSEAKHLLKYSILANIPTMLYGSPGIGKSDIVKSLAKELNYHLVDLRLSTLSPLDLTGFPKAQNEKMSLLPLDSFILEGDEIPNNKEGIILFLDEFNSADKFMQGAAYKLLHDRAIGHYNLHPKTRIILAGNRAFDKGLVNVLLSPIKTRITHLEVAFSINNFLDYVQEQVINDNWHPMVLSYLKFKPEHANTFDPEEINNLVTCAVPRTWEMVSKLLKHSKFLEETTDKKLYTKVFNGYLGSEVGTNFSTFLEVSSNLPTIEEIINNPQSCKLPENISEKYALCGLVYSNINKNNFKEIVSYINRIPENEIAVFIYKTVYKKCPSIISDRKVVSLIGNVNKKIANILAKNS